MKKYKNYTLHLHHEGFTLIETILSFLILSLCLFILGSTFSIIPNILSNTSYIDDRVGILQVRMILAQSRNIMVFHDELQFQYQKEDFTFRILNHKLVKQRGYEIFLKEIDNASFYKIDSCISLQYEKDGKRNEAILYCE